MTQTKERRNFSQVHSISKELKRSQKIIQSERQLKKHVKLDNCLQISSFSTERQPKQVQTLKVNLYDDETPFNSQIVTIVSSRLKQTSEVKNKGKDKPPLTFGKAIHQRYHSNMQAPIRQSDHKSSAKTKKTLLYKSASKQQLNESMEQTDLRNQRKYQQESPSQERQLHARNSSRVSMSSQSNFSYQFKYFKPSIQSSPCNFQSLTPVNKPASLSRPQTSKNNDLLVKVLKPIKVDLSQVSKYKQEQLIKPRDLNKFLNPPKNQKMAQRRIKRDDKENFHRLNKYDTSLSVQSLPKRDSTKFLVINI